MTRIAFKPHLHATVLGNTEVLLIGETGAGTILHGRTYARLAPLIDGTRTADDIVSAASDVRPELAYYALTMLEKNGHVGPAAPEAAIDAAAFWSGLGLDAQATTDALAAATIAVVGAGAASGAVGALHASFDEIGVRATVVASLGTTLVVCAVDDYLSPALPELERQLRGRAWMPVKPGGQIVWYGPVFTGASNAPCLSCLRLRIQENRGHHLIGNDADAVAPPAPLDALTTAAAASLAAVEAGRWIASAAGGDTSGGAALFTWDSGSLLLRRHQIVPHHACPRCFPPVPRDPRQGTAIALRPTPGRFSIDGGTRPLTADAMLEKLAQDASPICGVLPDLERIPCDGLTSAHAGGGAYGKGVADEQGRVSCWMEALEMRNAAFTGSEPAFQARYADLGPGAVDPAGILLVSARQYAERDALNRTLRAGLRIPPPFDDQLTISWTPVWSLLRRETRYVPAALCYFRHPERRHFGRPATNGGAAGAALEDAILHAALELVERDAVTLWWYSRASRPALDLAGLREPAINDIVRAITAKGDRLWVLDVTTDFALPVVAAIRCRPDGRLVLGFGAGLHADEAVVRALTELEQINALNRRRPVDLFCLLDAHPWLEPANGRTRSIGHGLPSRRDVAADLQRVFDRFEATGHDLLVLDTSRAGIDVATVRVFSPGLRHWIPSFAPGRLYDVPVALGWIDAPLDEDHLNEAPFWA